RDSTGKLDSPFKFFFKYIRKNIKIINEKKDDFYDTIFKDYLLISSKTLYDDDIIETIRVLFKIFEKVQYYTALIFISEPDIFHHTYKKKRKNIDFPHFGLKYNP
ncbi:unnamed protein product, partial [marine sediment metagenome]